MNDLQIKGTIKSPTFDFNYEKEELNIKGRSHPEDVITVYKPALQWLEEYSKMGIISHAILLIYPKL